MSSTTELQGGQTLSTSEMISHREWIPPMLRVLTLLPLAVLSFAMIAALEVLHHVTLTRVLSPQNETILNLIRYMPTFGAIAIGYIFKGIVSDLKKVTPWANMSEKWATGSNSVLLDYINDLEIVAVFAALGRKHWAVAIGLLGAFICGALVPFANSLAYVDLFAHRTITTTFTQTSVFNFDNHPLAMTNGSLKIPWNFTGVQPYARAISEQLGTRPKAVWTTGNYAFDQFTFPDLPNATVTAEVNAISATMNCQQVRYSLLNLTSAYSYEFVADPNDLKAAGCTRPLISWSLPGFKSPFAWLNITQCSDQEDDVRILVNCLTGRTKQPGDSSVYLDNLSMIGSICSPQFTSQRVSLSVNTTNSEISAFSVISERQVLDLKTSTEALWIYLQNPLDSETQSSFGLAQVGGVGPYNPTTRPVANVPNITSVAEHFATVSKPENDPFMQVIMNGQSESDPIDLDVFEAKVVDFAGKIWAAVISFLARTSASNELPGRITVTEQRVLLRTPVLRTFEALLAVVGVLAIIFALRLRPKTVLKQDPGSLAAAATILSVSDTNTEKEMAKQAISSAESMTANLRSARFTLQRNAGDDCGVTMDHVQNPDQVEMVALSHRKLGTTAYQSAPAHDLGTASKTDDISQGWRPVPLRLASKVALQVAIVVVMIGLGIMLWLSSRLNGICVHTKLSSTALALATSTILVLLGYCCAGVDGAAQSLAPFNVLRKRPNAQSIFTDDLSFLGRFSGLGSRRINITLLTSAAYILVIPAMKLVAAGLFSPVDTLVVDHVNIQLDSSMTANLEKTFNTFNYSSLAPIIKRACNFAEWERMPNFDLRSRTGIIGNLVLTDMMAVVGEKDNTSDSVIEARVPAIAVDVQCEPIPTTDFNLSIAVGPDGMVFTWFCGTERCHQAMNMSSVSSLGTGPGTKIPSYVGTVVSQDWRRLPAQGPDLGYSLFIADYTSLGDSVESYKNTTAFGSVYDGTRTWATPGSLNVALPTTIGTSCKRNLSVVNVNATFTRPTEATIGSGMQRLPWRPVSVDTESIVYERPYPKVQPYYFQPPTLLRSQYADSHESDGRLWGDSLWPTRGSSQNFFELLAVDAQYRVGNLSRLLDPAGLADSAKYMYTAYCAQLLTELRIYAGDASLFPAANQIIPATRTYRQPRVRQDARATYVLEALLVVLAVLALLVFYHFPSKAILPKSPGSIAARFSLLANSTLVRQMRETRVTDLEEVRKWREPAALGWWLNGPLSSTKDETSSWRWGVDIGRDITLQSWKDPPPSPPTRYSLRSAPTLPELNFDLRADEIPLTATEIQRSSVSSLETFATHDREDDNT